MTMSSEFVLLMQISKEIASLHDRAISLEEECRKLRNETTAWKRTAYFLGGQLSVFKPNEHPEKLVLDAYESQGEK